MKFNMVVLALCLLVFAIVASAGSVDEYHKPPPHKPPPEKCTPAKEFAVCLPFVRRGYYGHPPLYWSPCCKLIRKETPDCICKVILAYKHKRGLVDLKKIRAIPKACGKLAAKYYCEPDITEEWYTPPHHDHKSPPPHHRFPPPHHWSPPHHDHKSPPPHHK